MINRAGGLADDALRFRLAEFLLGLLGLWWLGLLLNGTLLTFHFHQVAVVQAFAGLGGGLNLGLLVG